MTEIKLALLDMNNNHPNQGMRNIREISAAFQKNSEFDVKIEYFDVRYKNEMPNVADFDIFISSGGPGTPHKEGYEWEEFGGIPANPEYEVLLEALKIIKEKNKTRLR